MVESLIIRILARLMALGALTGSFILLIICNIGTPVFNEFNYSNTNFDDGGNLKLGIWGVCYTPANGNQQCTKSSVGYNFSPSSLPGYSANPGNANLNVVNKPLSESLIWVPLALASTGLALLLVLLPIRIVTLLCIFACFLAVGATLIAFLLAIICFAQANARLGLLFNPNTSVHPEIGHCVWFLLACLTVNAGSFIFMVAALSPKKNREQPMKSYGDPVGRSEKVDGIDYGYRKPGSTRSRSTRPVYNAYDDDLESRNGHAGGLERSGSRRSRYSDRSGRSRDRRDSRDYDEDRRSARRSQSARRSRRAEDDEEDDYSPGY